MIETVDSKLGALTAPQRVDRFREFAVRLIEAHAAERMRLSGFLHDEVAQSLSAAGLQLDILRLDLEAAVPEIGERTAQIQNTLEQIVVRIRDLSYDLNPEIVERTGLQIALDRLVERTRQTFDDVRLQFDSSIRVPRKAAAAAYHIAECAVENALRHSGCRRIEIVVRKTRRGLALDVRDDGRGFDLDQARLHPPGLGLVMMEYHARRAGLELSFETGPASGTCVRALAPDSARVYGRQTSPAKPKKPPST